MHLINLVLLVIYYSCLAQAGLTRVLGGAPTTIEQYPIVAQLLRENSQYCAGVLLTVHHVISTAHCFQLDKSTGKNFALPSFWKIRVGSSFRSGGGSVHNVKSIILHPNFNRYYFNNDLSVIVVSHPFPTNHQVKQATIPKQGTVTKSNSVVTLLGWGMTMNGATTQPDQLQYATLHIIDQKTCNYRYNNISAIITDAMICGGVLDHGGLDGCHGDSGGPLLYKGVVIGLVSFGYSCGHSYYPGVYTKVSHFSHWIVNTISSNN